MLINCSDLKKVRVYKDILKFLTIYNYILDIIYHPTSSVPESGSFLSTSNRMINKPVLLGSLAYPV
jgi:hypothetical protein